MKSSSSDALDLDGPSEKCGEGGGVITQVREKVGNLKVFPCKSSEGGSPGDNNER
jgi:hypothetical protein